MNEESALLNQIASTLYSLILKIRMGNKIEEEDLDSLSSLIPQLEDELLKLHLNSIIKELRNNSFDERSILGKSIRLNKEELGLVVESISELTEEEPFKEMDSKNIMILWRETLNSLIKELPEEIRQ